MKLLAMHITNQKLSFDIFTVGHLQNIFMEHDLNIPMIFGIKESCIILTHTVYCCLLLQTHLCCFGLCLCSRVTCLCLCHVLQVCLRHWSASRAPAAAFIPPGQHQLVVCVCVCERVCVCEGVRVRVCVSVCVSETPRCVTHAFSAAGHLNTLEDDGSNIPL